jgi:lysozyme family protein
VLHLEGGYGNDPRDKGLATKYGVSLRYLRALGKLDPADGTLLGDMDHDGDIDIVDIRLMTVEEATKIYQLEWWDKYRYDRIRSDSIAFRLLDQAVLSGPTPAHRVLQRAANTILSNDLTVDGVLGPMSIAAINSICETDNGAYLLETQHKLEAIAFYRSLNNPVYIRGWINRVTAPIEIEDADNADK